MPRTLNRLTLLILVSALCPVSAGAVTPAQLVSPFFGEQCHVAASCENVKKLFAGTAPLERFFSTAAASALELDVLPQRRELALHAGSAAVRWSYDPSLQKIGEAVFACEVDDRFTPAAAGAEPFQTAPVPDGTAIRPLDVVCFAGEPFYTALLTRGGQRFLIGASRAPACLSAMAAVPDDEPAAPPHAAAPVQLALFVPERQAGTLLARTTPLEFFDGPFKVQIAFSGTPRSIRAHLWNNVKEIAAAASKGSAASHPAALMSPVREKPLLVGSGPLLALLSFEKLASSADTLRPELKGLLRALAEELGLDADDLIDMLHGRVTLGAAGRSGSLLGSFPGFYLHLSGVNQRVCSLLENFLRRQADSQSVVTLEPFELAGWKGLRTPRWSPFSAYVASSPRGFIAALQDSRELNRSPSTAPDMQRALGKPGYLTLSLDIPALTAGLQELVMRLGSLSMDYGQRRRAEKIFAAAEAFGVFNLTISDLDSADAELFVTEPQFSRLLEQSAKDAASRRNGAGPREAAENDASPRETERCPVPAATRARAERQFRRIFSDCVADAEAIYACYDGKPLTMKLAAVGGQTQAQFLSHAGAGDLGIGDERAERLVRLWNQKYPASPCTVTGVRSENGVDVTIAMTAAYGPNVTDKQFDQKIDQFLAGLDSFYDLLKQ